MEKCYLYAKYEGLKTFKAFDASRGCSVNNLIYATLVEDTEKTRMHLQRTADENKNLSVVFQMRTDKGKVVFQTA